MVFWPYVMTCVRRCCSSLFITEWFSRISRERFLRGITKFYVDIHAHLLYSHTGHGIIYCFRSDVITREKPSKMLPLTVSGRISRERLKQGLPNFTRLFGTISLTNLPGMTLLAASGRLKNAIKYCPKVHKMCTAGKEAYNLAAVQRRITKFSRDIHADLICSHSGYDVISCFRSAFIEVENTAENAASDCLVSIFGDHRFVCPTNWWAFVYWHFRVIWMKFWRETFLDSLPWFGGLMLTWGSVIGPWPIH